MSHIIRKLNYLLCENKGADQLCINCKPYQPLCFHYMDSTNPLRLKSEISSFQLSSETAQASLYQTWSEIPKTGFLPSQLTWLQHAQVERIQQQDRALYASNNCRAISFFLASLVSLLFSIARVVRRGRITENK